MGRPVYFVYAVDSMTGSSFVEDDIPERLRYVGACQAVNSDDAIDKLKAKRPALVLRANTVMQGALKLP